MKKLTVLQRVTKYAPTALRGSIMLVLAAFVFGLSAARADSVLHIGAGAGTSCATGCAGDPNQVGNGSGLDIYLNAGSGTLNQPVLLILGIPNDSTNLFATNPFSGVSFYNPYPGGTPAAGSSSFAVAGTYGLISPVAGGFFGDMGPGSEIYSFLDLQGPTNNSNSFTNWSGADSSINGITVGEFGIYVFSLSGVDLGPHGLLDIMIAGGLPKGTYAVAYGQTTGRHTKVFDTPFTESGLTTQAPPTVPEPASLLLFGSGLVGLGLTLRRQLKAQRVRL